MTQEPQHFLSLLFPSMPESMRLLLWSLQGKQSNWFSNIETAATFAQGRPDIYYGCCLAPPGLSPRQRCRASEVLAMPGVWLDIDIEHPGVHKRDDLFQSREDAIDWIEKKMALQPTIYLNSGHGLHVWWLFRELLHFETDDDRIKGGQLAYGWNEVAISRSPKTIDNLGDLARILRPPGTFNRKGGNNTPVEVLQYHEQHRYHPKELWAIVTQAGVALEPQIGKKKATSSGPHNKTSGHTEQQESSGLFTFFLNINAEPPKELLSCLLENDLTFSDTWHMKRKMPSDNSPSGYDLSLASQAVVYHWTDQQIVNMLIAFRRKHSLPLKLREDYYRRTLNLARANFSQQEAEEELEFLEDEFQEQNNGYTARETTEKPQQGQRRQKAGPQYQSSARQKAALKNLSVLFNIPIQEVRKYKTTPPTYEIVTAEHKELELGGIANITSYKNFSDKLADLTGHIIDKPKKWIVCARAILAAAIEIDAGDDARDTENLRNWIVSYLEDNPPTEIESIEADKREEIEGIYRMRKPFIKEGETHVFTTRFLGFVNNQASRDRLERKRYAVLMQKLGCQYTSSIRFGRFVARAWKLPKELP